MTQQDQGPLDKFLQENSIMYKGTGGNAYNTQLDEYYIERDGYSMQPQAMDPNLGCAACQTNNPPAWCFNPNDPCYDSSVPIDGALPILMIAGILLAAVTFSKKSLQIT